MVRLLVAFPLIILATAPAAAQQADQAALVARAREVVERLVSGEVEPLLPTLTDKMKAAIDANGLRRLIPSLVAQLGAFKSQTGARFESQGVMRVVLVSCAFERANVEIRVAFDPIDRLGGLGVGPPEPTVAYSAPAYVTASAFRDEAFTFDAGGWPLAGHAVDANRRWTLSRRGARPWFGPERSRRIDRTEQAVSRSGGGSGQPRDRGAAIRQADQDACQPGRVLSATSPSRRK